MNKTINWGIIGVGDVCEVKSGPAYQKTKGFQLKAVMRRNGDKAKDFAFRHEVEKYYTDADLLINDPEIDAIYIATPPDSHMEYALKVAKAGKICCVEKPMAVSYQQSLKMDKAFSSNKIPLFVAYYRRSLPRFNQVKHWMDNGEIGSIRHLNWIYSCPPHRERDLSGNYDWHTDKEIALGGYFDDLASHGLDLFTYHLGEIKDVNGFSTNQQNLYTSKDSVSASWIHKNGVTGSANWNFGSWGKEDKVQIFGSEGKITYSIFGDKEVILENKNGENRLKIEHPANIQLHHVQDMKKHIYGEGKHPSTGKTALHTAWVMDRILGRE